ncbi:MAG: tetratricopeptide repeat protein, partial [Ignavibacteriales bacterium]|nr:tetratricopeptide repeat protein [Ignavibacteriales bacterium]
MLLRKSYLIILFTLISQFSFSQQKVNVADALMRTAQSHMGAGRYGEAIDQLNKYIAALPQDPVG